MANSNQVAAIVLTLALANSGCTQRGGVPILVPEQDVIEPGECLVGRLNNVTIKVANHGTGELVIRSLTTSCTCSGASMATKTVRPGSHGNLNIEITPKTLGKGAASVVVETNCSISPSRMIRVEWEGTASVEAVPPTILFGEVFPGQRVRCCLRLRCRAALLPEGHPCRLQSVTSLNAQCVFEGRVPMVLESSDEASVGDVELIAGDTPGDFFTTLKLSLEGAAEKVVDIPVSWRVVNEVEVDPGRLSLSRHVADDIGLSSGVIIIRSPARELKIGRVEGSEPWFVATMDRPNSGVARITVKQTVALPAGIHTGKVVVDVQAPREQRISIPVSFTSMPKERTE